MTREIKHRGKAINGPDKGKWYYGFYWTNGMDNHFIRVTEDANGFCLYDIEVDPETVGEYTGLHDKNGREIYEGDIVKHFVDYGPAGEGEHISAVNITPFGINVQHWIFNEKGYLPEIIGNIYDNPELLKESED